MVIVIIIIIIIIIIDVIIINTIRCGTYVLQPDDLNNTNNSIDRCYDYGGSDRISTAQ